MTEESQVHYLPRIRGMDINYGLSNLDYHVEVVFNKKHKLSGDRPMVWIKISEDGNTTWARLDPQAFDDLITELLYVKQQIGG